MPAVTQLDGHTIQQMREILLRHGVTWAGIFGSFARGEADETSDVDLLVEVPRGTTLLDMAGLGIELEEALGRSVDLVTYESIHPRMRERILRDEVGIL
ncbi:MAG TPA: nucleotidyltransferase family protein [Ktedonobacterales bacterium]